MNINRELCNYLAISNNITVYVEVVISPSNIPDVSISNFILSITPLALTNLFPILRARKDVTGKMFAFITRY